MAGTTVKVAASLLPSLDAVIRTESDSARPVTRPVDETVACVGAWLVQVTGRSASSWPAASLTLAVSCSVWPITTPGAAAVTMTEATGEGGDWESLPHAATAPAPHSSRRCMALTSRSGRDTVPPLLCRGVGRINSWRLLCRMGRGDRLREAASGIDMALRPAVNSHGHGAALAEVVTPAVRDAASVDAAGVGSSGAQTRERKPAGDRYRHSGIFSRAIAELAPHVEAPTVCRSVCGEAAGMVSPAGVHRGERKPAAHGGGDQAEAVRAVPQLPVA